MSDNPAYSVLDPFRAEVRVFLERHGMTPDEFDQAAAKDENFCADLFAGRRGFESAKLDRIRDWMTARDRDAGYAPPPQLETPAPPPRWMEGAGARDRTFGEYDYDPRIEIYKVMIDSVERGIDRRHALNRFYFSVVVAMFVSISFVLNAENEQFPTRLVVSGALLLAFLNSVLWLSMIFAARRLSASKYDVINELEAGLDYAPFTREWEVHVAKRRNFPQFTLIELLLPATLAILCFVLFILIASGLVSL
ncbi:MAG: hypothetical protein AAFX03_02745 [Pseudomonadota bacterium]